MRAVAALKHRNFRLFWSGQLISLMGTWMQNMAQGWLVLQLTNSPFLLGLVSAVQFLPLLLFSLVAGVAADRTPKRLMLLATQCGSLILALILGLLTLFNVVRYWHVVILAGLLGTINAFDTPTRQSFVIELVGKKDLMNAIVLNSSAFNAARVIGPALAGLAIGKLGMATCFLLNAASFLAVIAGLLLMSVPDVAYDSPEEKMVLKKIGEGLCYIWKTPLILRTITLTALLSIFSMNFSVLIPVLARNTLGRQAEGYGYLMSAMGIGAFAGSLVLALLSHRGPRRRLLLSGALGLCVFQLFLSLNRSYPLALLFLGLMGWSMITFVSTVNTTLQLNVPDNLRGRVMSVYSLVFLGVTPLGSLFSGGIAHMGGAPAGLAAGAGMGLLSLAVVMFWEWRQTRAGKDA
ncbi:MAG TPA: MFS transporter [Syntrophomonadaceae bacterium]|nr:MFS transporter [Syntrophomonadaceae bacterium]